MGSFLDKINQVAKGKGDKDIAGRSAIVAFLLRVGGAGIAYLSQILLARWLGETEYGIFAYVWVWVLILGGFCTIGLNTAVIRFIPEYTETKDFARLRGVQQRARQITLIVSTLLMLTGLALLYLFGNHIEQVYVLPLFLGLFCLPAYGTTDLHDSFARGYSKMVLALSPPFVIRPLLILILIGAAWLSGLAMTATLAIGCALLACWLVGFIQWIWFYRQVGSKTPKSKPQYETRFWVATALPVMMMEGFVLLMQNTDILVLQLYRAPQELAFYYAALKTINLITFVHFAVSNAVANRFSAYNVKGEKEKLEAFVRDAVKWTFWPSFLGAAALLALGKPLLYLFGPSFMSAYPVMVILAIGIVIKSMFGPAEFLLNMLGEQKLCAFILGATVVLNLILNGLFVPLWGMWGAAVATSLSLSISGLLFFLAVRKRLGISIFI